MPFTAKEAFAVRGLPNSGGLVARKDCIAEEDAVVVGRLRQAGAIPIAISNCSELCMWWESANRVYGRTSNPFNRSKIVGGSSGGEGAIIGAAGSVFGVGSGKNFYCIHSLAHSFMSISQSINQAGKFLKNLWCCIRGRV